MSHGNSKYSCEKLNSWLTPHPQRASYTLHFDQQQSGPLSLKGEIQLFLFQQACGIGNNLFLIVGSWPLSPSYHLCFLCQHMSSLDLPYDIPCIWTDATFLSSMLLLNYVSHSHTWTYFPAGNLPIVPTAWRSCSLRSLFPPALLLLNPMLLLYHLFCVFPACRAISQAGSSLTWWPPCAVSCPCPHDDPLLFTIATSSARLQDLVVGWVPVRLTSSFPFHKWFGSTKCQ